MLAYRRLLRLGLARAKDGALTFGGPWPISFADHQAGGAATRAQNRTIAPSVASG